MKKNIIFLLLSLIFIQTNAQDKYDAQTKPIIEEGKLLYKLEKASWLATDIFLEKYSNRDNIAGYFSYFDAGKIKCIFFSNTEIVKVIGTITFDSTYNKNTANVIVEEREFNKTEFDLYEIRKLSLNHIYVDTMFKTYNNTNLNLIPIISAEQKKVYVLTGPQQSGVVIFGNDYLLTFDANNKLLSKKNLHKNIIPVYSKDSKSANENVAASMHSHSEETGEFITATDICTLMLYEDYVTWKQHIVVSAKYINIWDCSTDELLIMTKKEVEKITESENKRKKKKER